MKVRSVQLCLIGMSIAGLLAGKDSAAIAAAVLACAFGVLKP